MDAMQDLPRDGSLRVAQDGSGHFRTVQAAIDSLPLPNNKRVVIWVAPGVYRQPVYVPKQKKLITIRVWLYIFVWFGLCGMSGSWGRRVTG